MKKNLIDSDTFSLNLYKPPYIQPTGKSLEIGAHGISSLLNCTALCLQSEFKDQKVVDCVQHTNFTSPGL